MKWDGLLFLHTGCRESTVCAALFTNEEIRIGWAGDRGVETMRVADFCGGGWCRNRMWFLWGASDPRDGVVLSFFLRLLKLISEEDTRIVSWDDVHYVIGSELG